MIYLKIWNENLGYDNVFQEAHQYLIDAGAELVDEYDGGLYSEKEYNSDKLDIDSIEEALKDKVFSIKADSAAPDGFDSFGEFMDADDFLSIEVNKREKKGLLTDDSEQPV